MLTNNLINQKLLLFTKSKAFFSTSPQIVRHPDFGTKHNLLDAGSRLLDECSGGRRCIGIRTWYTPQLSITPQFRIVCVAR